MAVMLHSSQPSRPYTPGYIAFPNGRKPPHVIFHDEDLLTQPTSPNEVFQREQLEHEQKLAAEAALDAAWQKHEDDKRAKLEKIKEAELLAELEWLKLGGRIRGDTPAEAELRNQLDEEAKLTDEEKGLRRAWERYDKAWEQLVKSIRPTKTFTFRKLSFTFEELPWPVPPRFDTSKPKELPPVTLEDLTCESIDKFILHPAREPGKSRRDKLREAILKYHPDKFSRYLHRVVEGDRARVEEGVIVVTRHLNRLMNSEAEPR